MYYPNEENNKLGYVYVWIYI